MKTGPSAQSDSGTAGELPQASEEAERARVSRQALRDIIAPARSALVAGKLLGALSALLAVVPYICLVNLGDLLLQAANQARLVDAGQVYGLLGIMIAAYCGRIFLYFGALLLTHLADVKLNAGIRERILAAIGRAPLSWFTERTSGLVRKTLQDDVTALHILVAHKPVDTLVGVLVPFCLLGYVFYLDWRLGLVSLSLVVVYFAVYGLSMRGMDEMVHQFDARLERLSAAMVEFISGISVVKAFGTVGKAHARYLERARETNDYYYALVKPMLRSSALAMAVISAPMLLLVGLGGGAWLVAHTSVTPTQVIVAAMISLMVPSAVQVFAMQAWGQKMAMQAASRIRELLDCGQLEWPDYSGEIPAGHAICFENVSYSYGATNALRSIDLVLPHGSVTALVGRSGSGKSTLAKLVARFDDPSEGVVRIGGVDIRHLSEADLFSRVGFVLQDPQLLSVSITENIRLARPSATDAEVRAAAKAARIHEEIEQLPRGYNSVLGEDTQLSGGQQQRISIARAILGGRPILLLDEATAMTDPDCEADIQAALCALAVDKTVLVIAHRPASVRGADQIVLLDGGRILAAGSHEELVSQPHYQAILAASGTGHEGVTK